MFFYASGDPILLFESKTLFPPFSYKCGASQVYVASVHPDLSEVDLKTVFEAFGNVLKCQLARVNGANKGAHRYGRLSG